MLPTRPTCRAKGSIHLAVLLLIRQRLRAVSRRMGSISEIAVPSLGSMADSKTLQKMSLGSVFQTLDSLGIRRPFTSALLF